MPPFIPILAALLVTLGVVATPPIVDSVAGEGIGPDNPVYGLERAGESIKDAIGFTNHTEQARERLRELESMNKENTMRLEQHLADIDREMEQISNQHMFQEILQHRNEVLTKVMEHAPEEAKPAIEHAMNAQLQYRFDV